VGLMIFHFTQNVAFTCRECGLAKTGMSNRHVERLGNWGYFTTIWNPDITK